MKYQKKPISAILRSNNTVFTFKDISIIWGDTDKKALIAGINYYVKIGALYRIRRGIYAKDRNYNKFELATKIFSPSYVSFETILAKNGVVFQFYGQIFVASYLTREITIDGQIYSYRKIKDSILTNHAGIVQEKNTTLASIERAFLDVLYLDKSYYFDNLSNLNWEKVFEILPIYGGNRRMESMVKQFYEEDRKDQI
jgi:predicted transcriptional regulator of viral defense system